MENILDDNLAPQHDQEQMVQYVGFWPRVSASLIDTFIFAPLIALSFYNLFSLKLLPLEIIILALMAAYKPFMEYQYGATLGKMAMRIKVVDADFNLMNVNQTIIRNSPWLVSSMIGFASTFLIYTSASFSDIDSFLTLTSSVSNTMLDTLNGIVSLFLLISAIAIAFDVRKQAIHDKMAQTYCIYKR